MSRLCREESEFSAPVSRAARDCAATPSPKIFDLSQDARSLSARGRFSQRGPWRRKEGRASSWCWASSRPAWPRGRKRGTPSAQPPRRMSAAARMTRNHRREIRIPAPRLSSPFCCCASPNIMRCDLTTTTAFAPIVVLCNISTMTSRFALTQVPAYIGFTP